MKSVSLCPFQHESATCRNNAAHRAGPELGLWGGGVNVMNWLYETVASSKSLIFTLL